MDGESDFVDAYNADKTRAQRNEIAKRLTKKAPKYTDKRAEDDRKYRAAREVNEACIRDALIAERRAEDAEKKLAYFELAMELGKQQNTAATKLKKDKVLTDLQKYQRKAAEEWLAWKKSQEKLNQDKGCPKRRVTIEAYLSALTAKAKPKKADIHAGTRWLKNSLRN